MKHILALIIKLVYISLISLITIAWLQDASVTDALMVAVVMTVALYIIGDLIVLPTLGNIIAIIADVGLAVAAVWLAPMYTAIMDIPLSTALLTGALVGVAEYFFHRYLKRSVLPGPTTGDSMNK